MVDSFRTTMSEKHATILVETFGTVFTTLLFCTFAPQTGYSLKIVEVGSFENP